MFFRRIPRSISTLTVPHNSWLTQRVDNDRFSYPDNIPSYRGVTLDFHKRLDPVFVLYSQDMNPMSAIDDFIVSRHQNEVDGDKKANVVSIMAAAKGSVCQQFLKHFMDAKVEFFLMTNFRDDYRARIGFIACCDVPAERQNLENFIEVIHKLSPLPDLSRRAFAELCDPEFTTKNALSKFPENEKVKPIYFENTRGQMNMRPYLGTYLEDDHHIPDKIPAIHQAIYDGDLNEVKQRLRADPYEVNLKDPWGIRAHELVAYLGSHQMYQHVLAVRGTLIPKSIGELDRIRHESVVNNVISTNDDEDVYWQNNSIRLKQNRIEYDKVRQLPIPVRSELHLACIHGDLETVKEILRKQPERLNEQDVRGYTPMLLAVANGHVKLTEFLLELGPDLKYVVFRDPLHENKHARQLVGRLINFVFGSSNQTYLRLIDNAATPEVMMLLFRHYVDPAIFNNRLELAVYRHDVEMAVCITHYLNQLPKFRGLSYLDLAVREAPKYDARMVKALLRAQTEAVPVGPYDTNLEAYMRTIASNESVFAKNSGFTATITPDMAALFETHNKSVFAREKRKEQAIKFIGEVEQEKTLVSQFKSQTHDVISILKPTNCLTQQERDDIQRIFFSNFELVYDDSEVNRRKYIENEITPRNNIPEFANIFYSATGPRVPLAFSCFEVIKCEDNFILYHARLGASNPEARSAASGLLTIAMRSMLAIKHIFPAHQVVTYLEALPPGMGLLAALPEDDIDFYPKFARSHAQINRYVNLSGEELVDNVIHTKLKVKDGSLPKDSKKLNLFSLLGSDSAKEAVPLCYEMNDYSINAFLKTLAVYDLHEANLHSLSKYLEPHLMHTPALRIHSKM